MPIRGRLRRIIRDLNLAAHLAVHTADCIIASTRHVWRERHRRPGTIRHELAKILRCYVGCAVDGRDSFTVDGDFTGRLPSQLPAQTRRQRRALADRRRRCVTVLLRARGDTPDAVQASLTRHWQIVGEDGPCGLIDDYLASRLVDRDRHSLLYVEVYAWVCNVGGTWIATPAAVRRYLRRAGAYERMFAAASCCATLKITTVAAFRMPAKIPANRTAGLVKCRPSSARRRERPVGCTPQRASHALRVGVRRTGAICGSPSPGADISHGPKSLSVEADHGRWRARTRI
jgi:hypothetical protein